MKYRVLEILSYGDSFPFEKQGEVWAKPDDVIELPAELESNPDKVRKLIELGLIEPIPEIVIHKPDLKKKSEEKPAD